MLIKKLIKEGILPKTLGVSIKANNTFITKEYTLEYTFDNNSKLHCKEVYNNKEYELLHYAVIETWVTFSIDVGLASYTDKVKIKEEVRDLIENIFFTEAEYEEDNDIYLFIPIKKRNKEIFYSVETDFNQYIRAEIEQLSFTLTKTVLIYPMF